MVPLKVITEKGGNVLREPRILILTASFGTGHIQVANSLCQEAKNQGISQVTVSNLLAEAYPFLSQMTEYLYLKCFSYGQPLYKMFYYSLDKWNDHRLLKWYYYVGRKRLLTLIQTESPDMIINTFPLMVVPEFRQYSGFQLPIFNVLTDYCLHKMWVHPYINRYFVATPKLKEALAQKYVPRDKIIVSGIPIRPAFELPISSDILYKRYKLSPNNPIVTILAGAQGLLKHVKRTCKQLIHETDVQIVVVCGHNTKLSEELSSLQHLYPHRLRVFPFVEQIDELFRLSTVMVTKPGGITLTEATATTTPLILYKPVPGQEQENARYFEQKRSAVIVSSGKDLLPTILRVIKDPKKQQQMKQSLASMYRPNASRTIIDHVIHWFENYQENRFHQLI
jgi:processive 1,2-diacylglycerol beta-glucosyltransferase